MLLDVRATVLPRKLAMTQSPVLALARSTSIRLGSNHRSLLCRRAFAGSIELDMASASAAPAASVPYSHPLPRTQRGRCVTCSALWVWVIASDDENANTRVAR